MSVVRIGIVGIGGYAKAHLDTIARLQGESRASLRAATVRNASKYQQEIAALETARVRVFSSYEEMLAAGRGRVDLVVITPGIDQHHGLCLRALRNGYHVLCEKPVAGTYQEAVEMREAARESARFLAIGFQYAHAPAVRIMKRISAEQELGRLICAKVLCYQPRSSEYYGRNSWAGRMRVGDKHVYDSPLQNSMGHWLHILLYVAGMGKHKSAEPVTVYGENYRANDIESADTQFIRVVTKEKVVLTAIASHAVIAADEPVMEFRFEKGTVTWQRHGPVKAWPTSGSDGPVIEEIEQQTTDLTYDMYRDVFEAILDNRVPLVHIDNSMQHTLCVEKLFESSNVHPVPTAYVDRAKVEKELYFGLKATDQAFSVCIRDLETSLRRMYREEKSCSEIGLEWARRGRTVHL